MRKYNEEMTRLMIRRWCDKAERSHQDVRMKLAHWGVPTRERDELIVLLIEQNLLNEARFAAAFANDKFRFNQWGAVKIAQGLKRKGVSDALIKEALKGIPKTDEAEAVAALVKRKLPSLHKYTKMQKRMRLMRALFAKGFDQDVIRREVDKALGEADDHL